MHKERPILDKKMVKNCKDYLFINLTKTQQKKSEQLFRLFLFI